VYNPLVVGGGLMAAAALSLRWQLAVDAPLLAYVALAMDRWGLVPYRDVYDFNTPGAYLTNLAIGKVFGFSELGFRLGDLSCLVALGASTALALRRFGDRPAFAAVLLFGFFYLGFGPVMSLQREYLVVVAIAAAVAAALSQWRLGHRALVTGLLVGVAATIKPQAAIVLPVFLMWLSASPGSSRIGKLCTAMLTLAGFAMPVVSSYWWLRSIGAADAFADIAMNYWPLYAEITGARPHTIVTGDELWVYRANRFLFSRDLRHLIVVPAAVGAWLAWTQVSSQRRPLILLIGVAIALELYPLAAGKYWGYHWLPSFYGASLLAALCFVRIAKPLHVPRDLVVAMVIVMLTAHAPGIQTYWRQTRLALSNSRPGIAAQIAAELRARLNPEDTVQPLDWTAGAVHALFLTQTRIATPFLYDFYFYHHVSTPYIQQLRAKLIDELHEARPAFVVTADQQRRFEGRDTTYQFDELSDFLRQDYHAVVANDRFVIYERNQRATKPASD